MTTGLLFIGKDYEDFQREALEIGVNRRVPIHSLRGFEWDDKIFCAKYDGESKKTNVMGYFQINWIGIINPQIYEVLKYEVQGKLFKMGENEISRFCGTYNLSEIIEHLNLSLQELLDLIIKIGNRLMIKPKISVGGSSFRIREFELDIPFCRTLRKLQPEKEYKKGIQIEGNHIDYGVQPHEAQIHFLDGYRQYQKKVHQDTKYYKNLFEY